MNPGSQALLVTLRRDHPNQSWGFRLQGGVDFTTPLSVQLVNPGGIAEICGLQAGDMVLRINDKPTEVMEHDQAKHEILMAQTAVNVLVQRGGTKIWKPKVTPLVDLKSGPVQQLPVGPDGEVYIQKTSLAADPSAGAELAKIGAGHNRTARPFLGFGGGANPSSPASNAAGSASAEYGNSGYHQQQQMMQQQQHQQPQRMIMQQQQMSQQQQQMHMGNILAESPPSDPDGVPVPRPADNRDKAPSLDANANVTACPSPRVSQAVEETSKQSRSFMLLQQELSEGGDSSRPSGTRSVMAPVSKPPGEQQSGTYITCHVCGMLIAGVFVKIKGNPMHPDCFKCCECGKSLKNKGYFDIGGKLYCDVHASQAAQPPGPDMVAVPTYR